MVIAVVGAGSWGTALSLLLVRNGHRVRLWGRDPRHVVHMRTARANERYLPGHGFPPDLTVHDSLEAATADADLVVVAVPSDAFDETLAAVAAVRPATSLAWVTKGFDPDSGELLDRVARRHLAMGVSTAVVSGPTFAGEVAAGLPAAVAVASREREFAIWVARAFHSTRFRAYPGTDMVGVQVGGGVKNVLAIAAGIADGLGFGANTRAALITRGLAELVRLGVAMGGRRETFMGLAGLGDLVLTCTDDQSRNRRFGLALAAGGGPDAARREIGQVVEGHGNASLAAVLAARLGVELPIVEQVRAVVAGETAPRDAVDALLSREIRAEE